MNVFTTATDELLFGHGGLVLLNLYLYGDSVVLEYQLMGWIVGMYS